MRNHRKRSAAYLLTLSCAERLIKRAKKVRTGLFMALAYRKRMELLTRDKHPFTLEPLDTE